MGKFLSISSHVEGNVMTHADGTSKNEKIHQGLWELNPGRMLSMVILCGSKVAFSSSGHQF